MEASPTTVKNVLVRKRRGKEQERRRAWHGMAPFSLSECYFLGNSIKPPSCLLTSPRQGWPGPGGQSEVCAGNSPSPPPCLPPINTNSARDNQFLSLELEEHACSMSILWNLRSQLCPRHPKDDTLRFPAQLPAVRRPERPLA